MNSKASRVLGTNDPSTSKPPSPHSKWRSSPSTKPNRIPLAAPELPRFSFQRDQHQDHRIGEARRPSEVTQVSGPGDRLRFGSVASVVSSAGSRQSFASGSGSKLERLLGLQGLHAEGRQGQGQSRGSSRRDVMQDDADLFLDDDDDADGESDDEIHSPTSHGEFDFDQNLDLDHDLDLNLDLDVHPIHPRRRQKSQPSRLRSSLSISTRYSRSNRYSNSTFSTSTIPPTPPPKTPLPRPPLTPRSANLGATIRSNLPISTILTSSGVYIHGPIVLVQKRRSTSLGAIWAWDDMAGCSYGGDSDEGSEEIALFELLDGFADVFELEWRDDAALDADLSEDCALRMAELLDERRNRESVRRETRLSSLHTLSDHTPTTQPRLSRRHLRSTSRLESMMESRSPSPSSVKSGLSIEIEAGDEAWKPGARLSLVSSGSGSGVDSLEQGRRKGWLLARLGWN